MLKRLLLLAGAFGLFAGLNPTASAGYLANSVYVYGTDNTFEDINRDALIDLDSSGTINKGDILVGFLRIDTHSPGPVTDVKNHVYAIYSQQLLDDPFKVFDNAAKTKWHYVMDFGPTTTPGLTLADILPAHVPPVSAGGLVALYDSTPKFPVDLISVSPGDTVPGVGDAVADALGNKGPDMFDYMKSITDNGTLETIAGFATPTDPAHPDFFTAITTTTVAGKDIVADTSIIRAQPSSISLASYLAGMTVLQSFDGVGYKADVAGNDGFDHQLVISAGNVKGEKGLTNSAEWDTTNNEGPPGSVFIPPYSNPGGFGTNTTFVVDPTTPFPEPSSVCLLGLGGAIFAVRAYRRRRRQAATTA